MLPSLGVNFSVGRVTRLHDHSSVLHGQRTALVACRAIAMPEAIYTTIERPQVRTAPVPSKPAPLEPMALLSQVAQAAAAHQPELVPQTSQVALNVLEVLYDEMEDIYYSKRG